MPVAPSTWTAGLPISAGELNQDMYTYDGSYFAAQGVMFHANRPLCHEAYIAASTYSSGINGNWVAFGGVIGEALSIVDNSALYGVGCDYPGAQATYQSFGVAAPGSSGTPYTPGGWVLMIQFITNPAFSGSPSAIGAGWWEVASKAQGSQGNRLNIGVIQQGNTGHVNCTFAIDIIEATNNSNKYSPSVFSVDPAGKLFTVASNTAPNTSGQTPRFSQVWVSTDEGTHTAATSIPVLTPYSTTTAITANQFNTQIRNSLGLLNYPPILELSSNLLTTIPTSTVTKVPFGASALVDNYSGWNSSTNNYIVPLNGLYFCHSTVIYGIASTSGSFLCGFTVNGTNYNGPNYPPATTNGKIQTATAITRVLDLHAGDTISTYALNTNTGGVSLSNVYYTRMMMSWMGAISSTVQTWTAPDVQGFGFQAGGTPGTSSTGLVTLFNSKIYNDISFLINRPYLLSYQTSAQSGLSNTSWTAVTMNTVAGQIHNSLGDNYNGWNASTHLYTAQIPGWYLCTSEVSLATGQGTAGTLVAGLSVPKSGGVTAPTSAQGPPDWYQEMVPLTSGNPSAATACGLYYLLAGETVQPMIQWLNASGTFGTSTSSFNSTFSAIWMSE